MKYDPQTLLLSSLHSFPHFCVLVFLFSRSKQQLLEDIESNFKKGKVYHARSVTAKTINRLFSLLCCSKRSISNFKHAKQKQPHINERSIFFFFAWMFSVPFSVPLWVFCFLIESCHLLILLSVLQRRALRKSTLSQIRLHSCKKRDRWWRYPRLQWSTTAIFCQSSLCISTGFAWRKYHARRVSLVFHVTSLASRFA